MPVAQFRRYRRDEVEACHVGREIAMLLGPRGEVVSNVVDADALGFESEVVEIVRRAMASQIPCSADMMDEIKHAPPTAT